MRTVQDIESLNLKELSFEQLCQIRIDLNASYYLTSNKELTLDGRNLKDLIRQQETRYLDEMFKRRPL